MVEPHHQDVDELLQELERASSTQESHPQDVEELLHVLQSGSLGLARRDAAEQLGNVGTIGPRIARALMTACESDPDPEVRRAAAQSLRGPVHPVYLGQRPDLMEVTERVLKQAPGLASPTSGGGGRLDLRLKRWGLVNAVLCGLLVVAIVASFVLAALRVGDTGVGMFFVIMVFFFIPVAFIPIGLSCLVGAIRSGIALRRHPSREARIGLRLSLGGPVAVIVCYALGFGIFFGIDLLHPIVSLEVEPHVEVNEVRLTDGLADLWAPAWSPDGSRLAFAADRSGDWAIYVMDADGSNIVQLTGGPAMASHPAWSPDGTRIAFESNRAGRHDYDIYVMDADGSNEVRLTQDGSDPAWSPDGSRIAFASGTYGDRAIYVMDADGSNVVRLTDGATQNNPAWSPDGKRIAFDGYGPDGYPHIFVMDADGSNVVRLTGGPPQRNPAWSPDGLRIAFVGDSQSGGMHIYMMDVDGANVVRLTSISDEDGDPAWSPDGSRIAYYCSHMVSSDICVIQVDE